MTSAEEANQLRRELMDAGFLVMDADPWELRGVSRARKLSIARLDVSTSDQISLSKGFLPDRCCLTRFVTPRARAASPA
ncbi:hypothetical protein [Microbacterium sp.]|uniref:hypothetical protein n=1 Tax=Microbacterium sp. TaxID=51671 RepID=UPI0028118993|nr:hypothetical protein [Microbacterium sp.]